MRELLQQALRVIETDVSTVNPIQYTADVKSVTAALREALSRSKWVKVADGLPVVPEGQYWAKFWVADKRGNIHKIRILAAYSTATIEHDFRGYTHYMYRPDDTPAPPEAE